MNNKQFESHVFAIWGPPMGGKTTMAVNMAVVLADSGYMTCLISATDHGELQAFFGTAIPHNKGMYAAISSGRNVREAVTEARPNLFLLEQDTGGDAYDMANIATEQVTEMLAELREQFSYIIIDCTSYKESIFTGLGLVEADKVVVCLPHRASAATWNIANTKMLEALAEKLIYVDCDTRVGGCNMSLLLNSIDLPECEIKFGCVESAYECENSSRPIVLRGGKAEKNYKKSLLSLLKVLLNVEQKEKSRKEAIKRGETPSAQQGYSYNGPESRFNSAVGIRTGQQSARDIRRQEDERIRRAQEEAYMQRQQGCGYPQSQDTK